jgi:hypothetical protein
MVVFGFVIILIIVSFIFGMFFKDLVIKYLTKFVNKIKSLFVKGE